MKNLIVAIWGENGVGKTTFSAALTYVLSRTHNGILLVSPDEFNPAFASLIPNYKGAPLQSFGRIADNQYFSADFLKTMYTPMPGNEAVGLMGYCVNDNVEKYNSIEENMAIRFFEFVKTFAEITIVDCSNPYNSDISSVALLQADIVLTLISPDQKGIGFYRASKTRISQCNDGMRRHLLMASPLINPSLVEIASNVIGKPFFDSLPYCEEVYEKLISGNLLSKYKRGYNIPVNRVAEIIKEEAFRV